MVASLYMAEAGLLAGLELVVRLMLVLVHVLQEVRSQGRWGWMRKIGVDHNTILAAHCMLLRASVLRRIYCGLRMSHYCKSCDFVDSSINC